MERHEIRFASGRDECAARHYPGTNGGCVIMDGGLAVTKEPGTDRFARRFHEAGRFSSTGGHMDGLGALAGRPPLLVPLLVPLTGEPGTVAVAVAPDGRRGGQVLNPDGAYPGWQQAVAARSVLRMCVYRPGRDA